MFGTSEKRIQARARHARPKTPRGRRGFTFAETMVALLILVMLAGFVGTAIQVAVPTYRQVVADSNAQVALSTTASALRDELGMAVAVKYSGGTMMYQTSEGTWATIENGTPGLVKREYADAGFKGGNTELDPTDLIPSTMIVGANDGAGLRVEMAGSIAYDESAGVFTVPGIRVLLDEKVVESIDEYKVKAVFAPGA